MHVPPLIDLDKHHAISVCGDKDSGKSVFLEWAAEQYRKTDRLVLDLFDAGDFENAFWCIKKTRAYPIILVHPPYIEINKGKRKYDILPMCDTEGLEAICERAIDEKRVISFGCGFYRGADKYKLLAQWINTFPSLSNKFKINAILLLREAADVAFSHIKIHVDEDVTRKAILGFIRKERHYRTAFIIDTQDIMDIYKGVRKQFDRTVIKKMSYRNMPSVFEEIDEEISKIWRENPQIRLPNIPFLRKPELYWLTGSDVFPHYDKNPLPSFYHREPEDDLWEITGFSFKELDIQRDLDDEDLNQKEHYELTYLRSLASYVTYLTKQRRLSIDGMRMTISKIADEIGIDRATLSKYTKKQS